jgi:hypothetical protein
MSFSPVFTPTHDQMKEDESMKFSGKMVTSCGARFGGWTTIGSAALMAIALAGAAGCALDGSPAAGAGTPGAAAPGTPASPAASAPPAEGLANPQRPDVPTAAPPVIVANPAGDGSTVTVAIDNSVGGTIQLAGGTALTVPAGALPAGVDSITITSSMDPAPSDYHAVTPMFVFGPNGAIFLKPLTVSMPVTLQDRASTADFTILWSRPRTDGFDMLPTTFAPVSGNQFIATASVNHFSRGMCGEKYSVDPRPSKDPYGE